MVKVKQLLIDALPAPVGTTLCPQINWKLESDRRGCRQSAYVLRVLDHVTGAAVFDSDWVMDGASLGHRIPEGVLEPARRYDVQVRVRTTDAETSAWSDTVSFVTNMDADWQAKFVSGETEADAENSGAVYLRKAFRIDGEIEQAYARATALGLYELSVNGNKAGAYRMAPGWTSYHKHLLYQTYDLTQSLRQGENCIGALVGAGWYKGKMGFTLDRNHYGKQTALLCELIVRLRDGRTLRFGTDETWQAARSPVLFSEIYDGETYDAAKEIPHWSEASCVAGVWKPVEAVSRGYEGLCAQEGGCVTEYAHLPVKELIRTPKGEWVADFGQNLAGTVRFCVHGHRGERVVLTCFETLDREGNVYLDNLRTAKQTIIYVFGTEQDVEFQPHFTYQGFRYVWVREWPEQTVEKEAFAAVGLCSEMEQTLRFRCSEPLLERLVENIRWGMRSNFLDIPTDCPQRDERVGWTGDAQIFCRTASYLMQTQTFFRKWLLDVAADQTPEGGVPHVVPDIVSGNPECADNWLLSQGEDSAAAWADAVVIIPWVLYQMYGDTQTLEVMYDSMKKWVDFMQAHSTDEIWSYKLQFGDWVALDAEEGSYFGATPNEIVCTAYYAYVTDLFAKMARILNKPNDHAYYASLHERIAAKFRSTFFEPDGRMTAQTQTAHILALHFHLTPDPKKTAEDLVELLRRENFHLKTGFVGTPYCCFALSENGYVEEAYRLLLQTDIPSWLYQVRMGATTVWEHWDSVYPDGTMWSADMNSQNHYAYGSIGEWLFRGAAGIHTAEDAPAFAHSILRPLVSRQLPEMETEYDSIYGTIVVKWKLCGETVTLCVRVPENTCATLELANVKKMLETDGAAFTRTQDVMTAELGSGEYQFVYEPEIGKE